MFDEEVHSGRGTHGLSSSSSSSTTYSATSPSGNRGIYADGRDCCSVFSFFLRGLLYLCLGVAGAVGAAGMASLNKKYNGGCVYNQKHPDQSGNCDFILYSHVGLCVIAFLFLAITAINICRSSFGRSKFVGFELSIAVSAFVIMLAVTGILTSNLSKLCGKQSLNECVNNLEQDNRSASRYILISGFGTWIATPLWFALTIVLVLRLRRAIKAPKHDDYQFNNPIIT
ncbi:hypothetical protein PTSG_06447 [Salpingoeca rosetta]|uniref:Uncharacterized protein n=1 Tax=Salpingoeca rosetta (strain ATCC 50818 / BSB-021) TaxID=946362 RepID=F2UFU2_SALR5|nr:uncharacterized protein PTSG_06447 [Salpingoeca rosetta]EGD75370.1 hypothetical protein PTSG_06447 [Salpingoeca rosetta]|eukprot:XP_004991827.1 hypothetical protein PTSG_06447 [Salpingoeca rosetta]